MKQIFFILFSIALTVSVSSCCKYNYSDEKNDLSMDFFGDGVYVNEVLVIQDEISLGTIAKPGKSMAEIRDFLGFIMNGGILYIVIDTRTLEGGLTQEMIDEVDLFKKEWAEGKYELYDRYVYPIWMVYGENEKGMVELNGYYEGTGWYIYVPGDTKKQFFTEVSSLSDINIFDYIYDLIDNTRGTIHCD